MRIPSCTILLWGVSVSIINVPMYVYRLHQGKPFWRIRYWQAKRLVLCSPPSHSFPGPPGVAERVGAAVEREEGHGHAVQQAHVLLQAGDEGQQQPDLHALGETRQRKMEH